MNRIKSKLRFLVVGEEKVTSVVTRMVRESRWFEVTPLPDDTWYVVAKNEGGLGWVSSYAQDITPFD